MKVFFGEKSFENISEGNVWEIKQGQYRNWELTEQKIGREIRRKNIF